MSRWLYPPSFETAWTNDSSAISVQMSAANVDVLESIVVVTE